MPEHLIGLVPRRRTTGLARGEFNSCENLIRGGDVHPIDYANASPDVALTSLHYYFPWAMEALVRWCVFCVVTGRRMAIHQDKRRYFDVAARMVARPRELVGSWAREQTAS